MGQHPAEKRQALRKEMHIHAEQVLPPTPNGQISNYDQLRPPGSPEPNYCACVCI